MMKIAVIGAGYVGLVSAACFAELGHQVITVDNDSEKVKLLIAGQIPIHENLLPELVNRHLGNRLRFSGDIVSAVQTSDVVFITVGTPPSSNGDADLSYVEGVAREVARSLNGRKVVVEKSTVPVRTCEALQRTMVLNGADRGSFMIASNPEFLREGTAVSDFLYPDRIVIGVDCQHSADVLKEIYLPLTDGSYYKGEHALPGPWDRAARLIVTSVKSAELIKHASNAFLAMKISFINAVANVCEGVGADIRQVCEGVGADSRIGPKFLVPGIGYGGSCFPKDVLAFRSVAKGVGYDFDLLTAVMAVNEQQRERFVEKVREALWTLRGKRLAVLGLAFKGGTDDVRDSPALDIVKRLADEGAFIVAYDPAAMERAAAQLSGLRNVTFADSAYEACQESDALLILTEWQQFKSLDLERVREELRLPIVIDGRNSLVAEEVEAAGLVYYSMGRQTAPDQANAGVTGRTLVSTASF
jgi:UDPglucose 6-dehydrogenase